MSLRVRAWPVLLLALLVLASFDAAAASTRVLLLPFSGRKADVLRDKVEQGLKRAGYAVVADEELAAGAPAARVRAASGQVKADLAISGTVRRHSMRLWTAALTVRGADGEPVGEPAVFRSSWLPGLAKELADTSVARLEERFEQAKAPPPSSEVAQEWDADKDPVFGKNEVQTEAPSGDEPLWSVDANVLERDAPQAEDAAPLGPSDVPVIKLRARAGMMRRSLDFVDDIYDRLRKQLVNSLVYQFDAAIYPFHRPFGEHLGLVFSYERTLSSSVEDRATNSSFSVGFEEFFGGLRARHSVKEHEVGFDLTLGSMRSELFDSGQANTPDFGYTLLRSSLDGTLRAAGFSVTGSLGFRLPLAYGEVSEADWFPRVGGYGVEAGLGASYNVTPSVTIDLSGSMRRYILEMNSEPEDAQNGSAEVAAGAVDLYLAGYLGLSVSL